MQFDLYFNNLMEKVDLKGTKPSDFNSKMLSVHHTIGATFSKKHATYHKVF
jgi:hypothetical protein